MSETISQKEIAGNLDSAAMRAGENAASRKQVWFLAGLMLRLGEDGNDMLLDGTRLTKRLASELIDEALSTLRVREAA